MTPPHLFVRADATSIIGTGHLQRCLALAAAWRDRGGLVTVCGRCESPGLARRARSLAEALVEPRAVHPDPADLERLLGLLSAVPRERSAVVIDGYHFDREFQSAVRRHRRVLVIDDLGTERNPDADIVLNQNIHAPQLPYRHDASVQYLLGLSYALLRTEFADYRAWQRSHPARARRVLITMGGSDADGLTAKAMDSVSGVEGLELRVLVGGANRHLDEIKVRADRQPGALVVLDTDQMALEMASADIAIAGAGSTGWELAFTGLPALLISLADNQEPIARGLHAAGAAVDLGRGDALDAGALRHDVERLCDDRPRRQAMSESGRRLLDGRGAERVAAALWDVYR